MSEESQNFREIEGDLRVPLEPAHLERATQMIDDKINGFYKEIDRNKKIKR